MYNRWWPGSEKGNTGIDGVGDPVKTGPGSLVWVVVAVASAFVIVVLVWTGSRSTPKFLTADSSVEELVAALGDKTRGAWQRLEAADLLAKKPDATAFEGLVGTLGDKENTTAIEAAIALLDWCSAWERSTWSRRREDAITAVQVLAGRVNLSDVFKYPHKYLRRAENEHKDSGSGLNIDMVVLALKLDTALGQGNAYQLAQGGLNAPNIDISSAARDWGLARGFKIVRVPSYEAECPPSICVAGPTF